MKKSLLFYSLLAWVLPLLQAQTQVDLKTQSKSVDLSGAAFTIPARTGTVLPATCLLGEVFFKTNGPAGQNIYACAPVNTWTLQVGVTVAATTNLLAGDNAGNALNSGLAPTSLVTLTGIQTLTNKSISANQITGLAASATTDTTNASNIASGTLAAGRLPNPTGTSLGGVEAVAPVSHNFLTGISVLGVPAAGQPSVSDISGYVAPVIPDWNLTSGLGQILHKPSTLSAFTNDAGFVTSSALNSLALSGDVTGTASASTVSKINGASLPASSSCLGTNASGQLIAGSCGTGNGGSTISSVTNLIAGNGTGSGVDSGIAPSSVVTLTGSQTLTNKSIAASEISGVLGTAAGGTGTATPSLVAGSNVTISGSWPNQTIAASATGSSAFSGLTSSTNSSAAMVVGTGASLASSGTGTIAATSVPAAGVTGILGISNGGTGTTTGVPVQSVAGRTGAITLSTSDISGYTAPVNPDWNASSGLAQILNKPTLNNATTVNGGSVPVSQPCVGTNASSQIVGGACLATSNNLSDLASASTSRTNLGLGTAATQASTAFDAAGAATSAQAASLQKASNLSDLASAAAARTNLGLGTAATQASTAFDASGAAATAQAAGLQKANNLSDLASAPTARTNLGLTGAATATLPLSLSNGGTGTTTPSLVAGSNVTISGSWPNQTIAASATGSSAFSGLTSSTNSSAAMVVGTGASLASSGTGTIAATSVPAAGVSGILGISNGGTGTTAGVPVQSVAGRTGAITLSTSDISGYTAPVNPDWNASSGLAQILNKPTLNNATTVNGGSVPVSQACVGTNASSQIVGGTCLAASNNLSDLSSASTARTNLGLGSAATQASSAFDAAGAAATAQAAGLQKTNNLSDLASAPTARTNLGLTGAATATLPLSLSNGGTGTTTPSLVAGSNVTISGSWPNQTIAASATGSSAFSGLTSSTNSSAAMIVGTGASLASSGTGTIAATSVPATGVSGILGISNGGTGTTTGVPVQSVAGRTGAITLSTSDISGYTAPVNPDWNASSGLAQILNKPALNNATTVNGGSVPVSQACVGTNASSQIVGGTCLAASNNLSDLASASTARTNLGLGTAATQASSAFDAAGAATTAQGASLQKTSNLSDLVSTSTARTNLGLTGAATATLPLSLSNGGTGTTTPSLVAGSNVTITGTWPNQTISSSASGSGGGGGGLTPPSSGSGLLIGSNNSTSTTVATADVDFQSPTSRSVTNYGNGQTNGIQAAVSACGASISCSIVAPPTYGAAESRPCVWGNVGQPYSTNGCAYTMSPNVSFFDYRYGIYSQNVDSGGLAPASNYQAWQRMDYITTAPMPLNNSALYFTSKVASNVNLLALGGGVNINVAAYPNKAFYVGNDTRLHGYTGGQKIGYQSFVNSYAVGDALGYYAINTCYGGFNAGSDEGCEAMDIQATQGTIEFTGTVTGTSSNTVSVAVTAGDGTQGEGRFLVDTSQAITGGTISAIGTTGPVSLTGSGTSWPVSTVNTTSASTVAAPGVATITVGSANGITTSTTLCVADGYELEQVVPTSVSGNNVTANFRYPHQPGMYVTAGGLSCHFIALTADIATNTAFPGLAYNLQNALHWVVPIISSSSSNSLTLWLESPNSGWTGYRGRWTAANGGYAIYPGAQVTSVMQNQKLSSTLTLETPVNFASGDAVILPLYHNLNVYEALHSVQRVFPQVGGGNPAAWWMQLNGLWTDTDTAMEVDNNTPASVYTGGKSRPLFMHPRGSWDSILYFDAQPTNVAKSDDVSAATNIFMQNSNVGYAYLSSDPINHRWSMANYFNGSYILFDWQAGNIQTTGRVYASGYVTQQIETGVTTNNDLAGSITLSSGTGTYSFTGGYANAPVCTANDNTAVAAVRVQTTKSTLTLTGTGSDVVSYICIARF